ncbi:MAG: gliding motility-associated C-terminal domain-containing protein, partial [Bacteroidota bacterium]
RDKIGLMVIGNNCPRTEAANDYQVYAPNVFSPNGDGINDRFFLQGNDFISVKSLRIFSRWGELVFEAENMPLNEFSLGWDGTFKGEKSGNGVFAWLAEIETANGEVKRVYANVAILKKKTRPGQVAFFISGVN